LNDELENLLPSFRACVASEIVAHRQKNGDLNAVAFLHPRPDRLERVTLSRRLKEETDMKKEQSDGR
jgi:hypothetical protein